KKKKKDRHSKVNTLRGPRDRRMRLSVDVAAKFFRLQDLLGFHRPSATLDWLIKTSADAIGDLQRQQEQQQPSRLSSPIGKEEEEEQAAAAAAVEGRRRRRRRRWVGRESRERARERARERTSQK
ncbi:hypothetical protein M569_04225, partial [Genlisea aurea]